MTSQDHSDLPVIFSIYTTAAEVALGARAFALQAEGWVFESQPLTESHTSHCLVAAYRSKFAVLHRQ